MLKAIQGTFRRQKKSLADDLTALINEYRVEQMNMPNSLVRALYLESNKEYKTAQKLLNDIEGNKVIYTDEDFASVLSPRLARIIKRHSNHELPEQYQAQLLTYKHQTLRHTYRH